MAPPFLVVNPRSGGPRPTADELVREAARRGIDAHVLRPGDDAGDAAREAAGRGAQALGVAGGDGSLAAVAAVAIEHDLPFACVPFGTRNHFAADAGIPGDPIEALAAFGGSERRVDVGAVGNRVFLNNLSLGIYASFVHDPQRQTRNRLLALARMAPAALGRDRPPLRLLWEAEGRREQHDVLLAVVGNNGYELTGIGDLGSRARLDEGRLHLYAIEAGGRAQLLGLLARAAAGRLDQATGYAQWASAGIHLDAPDGQLRAALDGEPVALRAPLELTSRQGALRLLVPAEAPS